MIRVLLVDDHPVLRDGLRDLLGTYDDLTVVGAAADGAEAGRLAAVAEPDVVLMDLRMPGTDGVAGTVAVKQAAPRARVLVLTALSDYEHIVRHSRLVVDTRNATRAVRTGRDKIVLC